MNGKNNIPDILPITPENYPERVPAFTSEEEAREFWDTHDSSFYWDQMVEVADFRDSEPIPQSERPVSTAKRRRYSEPMDLLSLRFPGAMIEDIRKIAEERHLPYQTLIRSWVGERLASELVKSEVNEVEQKKAS